MVWALFNETREVQGVTESRYEICRDRDSGDFGHFGHQAEEGTAPGAPPEGAAGGAPPASGGRIPIRTWDRGTMGSQFYINEH